MLIPASWERTFEFACHESSCAPPPAGTGGSNGGHGYRVGDKYKDASGPGRVTKVHDDGTITVYRDITNTQERIAGKGIKSAGTDSRKHWNKTPKTRGSDDGHDAIKDAGYNSRYHRTGR